MMKYAIILLAGLLVTGCSDQYRYPCQDPVNWKNPECQHPLCEVDGECRDTLTDGVSEKVIADPTVKLPVAAKTNDVEQTEAQIAAARAEAALADRAIKVPEEHTDEQ